MCSYNTRALTSRVVTHRALDEVEHVLVPHARLVDDVEIAARLGQRTGRRVLEVLGLQRRLRHDDEEQDEEGDHEVELYQPLEEREVRDDASAVVTCRSNRTTLASTICDVICDSRLTADVRLSTVLRAVRLLNEKVTNCNDVAKPRDNILAKQTLDFLERRSPQRDAGVELQTAQLTGAVSSGTRLKQDHTVVVIHLPSMGTS